MPPRLHLPLAALLLGAAAPAVGAQVRWQDIGATSTGNRITVDPRSIRRTGGLVAATVRIVFATPVQTPQGAWKSGRTKATFDCAKQSLAASETVYYADERGSKVVERKVNKMPGYGVALKGSLGDVAMTYLCKAK
ncbi:MAG: hypothetical protein JWN79_1905 [Gemmatimonadetes bacterium]|jgi:hypothetical protein|nr:hypothetical protein [Gemmatimonadota bacterium]